MLRSDIHYCRSEVIDWCPAGGHDFILGVEPKSTFRRHVADPETNTKGHFDASPTSSQNRLGKSVHFRSALAATHYRMIPALGTLTANLVKSAWNLSQILFYLLIESMTTGTAKKSAQSTSSGYAGRD